MKRNLAIIGDRKKDKMKTRNLDSVEHSKLDTKFGYKYLGSIDRPLGTEKIEQSFFCEKCGKTIPESFWRRHKENHKKLERMGGMKRKFCRTHKHHA